jgi:hypothetical protein
MNTVPERAHTPRGAQLGSGPNQRSETAGVMRIDPELPAVLARSGVNPFSTGSFLDGELSFDGLPAGYSVVSCSGYPSTVSVQPVTWSVFKQRYR